MELNCVDGSIGFAMGARWVSRAIAWFLKADYSHVFLGLHHGHGRGRLGPMILEADSYGVEIDVLDVYAKRERLIEIYEPLMDTDMVARAMDAVFEKYYRRAYGYLQLVGFALVLPLRRLGLKIRNPFGGGIICSELVWEYFRELGFTSIYESRRVNNITPADIQETLEELVRCGAFQKVPFQLEDGHVSLEKHEHPT